MTNDQKAALAKALGWKIISEIGGVYVELPDGRHPDLEDSAFTMPILRRLVAQGFFWDFSAYFLSFRVRVWNNDRRLVGASCSGGTPEQAVLEAAYAALVGGGEDND